MAGRVFEGEDQRGLRLEPSACNNYGGRWLVVLFPFLEPRKWVVGGFTKGNKSKDKNCPFQATIYKKRLKDGFSYPA
ncbi:unnamed protein product [Dovyalis caffra]|uniref:LAGLIDADG homing endonuclease n=1 Tax=Dovyalis caffra TaxID=77055 RepID=A0AAV1S0M1_9ROSI|nr:unnamed protein product [Dovyalis caffra]